METPRLTHLPPLPTPAPGFLTLFALSEGRPQGPKEASPFPRNPFRSGNSGMQAEAGWQGSQSSWAPGKGPQAQGTKNFIQGQLPSASEEKHLEDKNARN